MSAESILEDEGLSKIAAKLRKLARDSIEFTATRAEDGKLRVGTSKIGGAPDLPAGTAWPMAKLPLPRKHGPIAAGFFERTVALPDDGALALPFVAQIALADVAKLAGKQLPARGLLSFFYNALAYYEEVKLGTKGTVTTGGKSFRTVAYMHPANCRVIYTEDPKSLARLALPDALPAELRYPALKLAKPKRVRTLPSFESIWFHAPGLPGADTKRQLALTDGQRSAYCEAVYDARANRATHMLLGHADYMQPYALENGHKLAHDALWPKERKLGRGFGPLRDLQDSQLLLQVSTQDQMRFGRDGRLYFFIRNTDLAARDFSRVWAYEQ